MTDFVEKTYSFIDSCGDHYDVTLFDGYMQLNYNESGKQGFIVSFFSDTRKIQSASVDNDGNRNIKFYNNEGDRTFMFNFVDSDNRQAKAARELLLDVVRRIVAEKRRL